jgi:hypothetical protein
VSDAPSDKPAQWAALLSDVVAELVAQGANHAEAKARLAPILASATEYGIPWAEAVEESRVALARFTPLSSRFDDLGEGRTPGLVVTWDEFMAERDEAAVSLWGDALIVPGSSYTIIGGLGGVGKTILWTNLILALAAGWKEFLGLSLPGRPVPVLLAEAEGSRARFRERLRAVATRLGLPAAGLPITFPRKDSKLWIADSDFPRMIEQSRAEFVLLDPITAFHEGEDNSNTDWRRYVRGPLADLSRGLGVAFGLSDHYGKPSDSRQGRHKLIGASAKINDAGAALRMEVGQGGTGSRILFFDRVRDGALPFPEQGEPSKMPLLVSIAEGTIQVDDRPDATELIDSDQELRAAVLDVIKGTEGLATGAIAERLGKRYDPVKRILEDLERRGLVWHKEKGTSRFWFSGTVPQAGLA